MALEQTVTTKVGRRRYWEAQSLAELALADFNDAVERGDEDAQQEEFYLVAHYYNRTGYILRSALDSQNEALVQAALENLITLHRPLATMHSESPGSVPLGLLLDKEGKEAFVSDLIVRVLAESPEPLTLETTHERVNALDILGSVRKGTVQRLLKDLVPSGYVERHRGGLYERTGRVYPEMDIDAASFRTLVGLERQREFAKHGIINLHEITSRQEVFREVFGEITGLYHPATVELFMQTAATILHTLSEDASPWHHNDLLGSVYPRPYQYEAYSVFRGYGYQGQVIESPTGSGKTMIGMMCIQDFLRTLSVGQSILILVPTKNYQQQWIGELCYKPIGLRISPEVVFTGTPSQLEQFQKRTGNHPAISIMTYTSLSQTGSAIGKGGFDADSVEIFLQDANVQYVVLDEVHKVAEDLKSGSASVTRLLVEWLEDTSIRGLIGFSGTAELYRKRFESLGLDLVHSIPLEDLIAYGFVAPFAEFGVPFANSARERQVRDLLDVYKEKLRQYFDLLSPARMRQQFAAVPMDRRVAIGRDLLGMYRGRSHQEEALAKRFTEWENGRKDQLGITESRLVSITQAANGWSDVELVENVVGETDEFETIQQDLDDIRRQLTELIYSANTLKRLQQPGFCTTLDSDRLNDLLTTEDMSIAARIVEAKGLMTTVIVGLYEELTSWYRRVGEGRVETIKAVVEAERAVRPVSGIIVFDNARQIHWKEGLAIPGYEGVGGLFAQMLGDDRFLPVAVLSSEIYLAHDTKNPIPPRIAEFVERELMRGEVAEAIFGLSTQGIELGQANHEKLEKEFYDLIDSYIPSLKNIRARRPGNFSNRVLKPLRKTAKGMNLGADGQRLLMRLDLRNDHLAGLVNTFFDYALIARSFRTARVAELEQVSGAREKFFVVTMPGGNRKQLMYDLTARIVDDQDLGVNLIIVSNWARTGWNVIKPNVLIDATATRDVTAWQQLRGRAIRAMKTWTNDCYRLIVLLGGNRSLGFDEEDDLPEDVARTFNEVFQAKESRQAVDDRLQEILEEVAPPNLLDQVRRRGLKGLSEDDRLQLAIALMRARNKVTHIYELIKAYGSTSQVTYDRTDRRWRRRDNIALKHATELSVHPFSGEKMYGAEHAPMLYEKDPRTDLPVRLQKRVDESIKGSDVIIVTGWMKH